MCRKGTKTHGLQVGFCFFFFGAVAESGHNRTEAACFRLMEKSAGMKELVLDSVKVLIKKKGT